MGREFAQGCFEPSCWRILDNVNKGTDPNNNRWDQTPGSRSRSSICIHVLRSGNRWSLENKMVEGIERIQDEQNVLATALRAAWNIDPEQYR